MSILNRPSDGLFNVLIAIYKLILQEGALAQSKVLALCAPPTVAADGGEKVRQTLNTWVELGLFERAEPDNTVQLTAGLPPDARDPNKGIGCLSNTLRRLVLAAENNPDIWSAEGARSGDFSRAASWVLAQDPFAMSEKGWNDVEKFQLNQGYSFVQNDTRWAGFCSWANYLGFGWYPAARFMPDPTDAIESVLPTVFAAKSELDQAEFFSDLSRVLPVLDGGRYRLEVEARIRPDKWAPPGEGRLSRSLSMALQRLKLAGVLEYSDRADSPRGRVSLTATAGQRMETLTHVKFLGGRA